MLDVMPGPGHYPPGMTEADIDRRSRYIPSPQLSSYTTGYEMLVQHRGHVVNARPSGTLNGRQLWRAIITDPQGRNEWAAVRTHSAKASVDGAVGEIDRKLAEEAEDGERWDGLE